MKKTMILLLLCMILFLTGCQKQTEGQNITNDSDMQSVEVPTVSKPSEKIRTRMNAPERLDYTFASNSGKTQVRINAAVEVPNVSCVNLYEVTAKEISARNVTALADHLIGEGAWSGDTSYGLPEVTQIGGDFDGVTTERMFIESQMVNARGQSLFSLDAHIQRQNGVLRGAQVMNYRSLLDSMFSYNFFMCHDRQGMDAKNCSYTRSEALRIAQSAAEVIAPELTEVSCGIINDMGMPESTYSENEAYLFCFTRNVDGIPVTYTMQECNYTDEDENDNPIHYRMIYPYESLRLVVTGEGVVNGRYESPYAVSEPIQTDVQLLEFDQVLEIAKNILPLTFTWMESTYQIEITIDRVVFGYARLDFKDDMYRYKLVPVWDFFGTYQCYKNGELIVSHTEDFNSLLTVNAMDGTIIDRRFGF